MKNIILALGLVYLLTSCGVIPSAYQGKFVDSAAGVNLELKVQQGILTFGDQRVIKSPAADLKFEDLLKGKSGIYASINPTYENYLEIYWTLPKIESKQEEDGFVWFDAEVLYTLIDLNKKKKEEVSAIKLIHCYNGTVLLDIPTKRWQISCPAGPEEYNLVRVK